MSKANSLLQRTAAGRTLKLKQFKSVSRVPLKAGIEVVGKALGASPSHNPDYGQARHNEWPERTAGEASRDQSRRRTNQRQREQHEADTGHDRGCRVPPIDMRIQEAGLVQVP